MSKFFVPFSVMYFILHHSPSSPFFFKTKTKTFLHFSPATWRGVIWSFFHPLLLYPFPSASSYFLPLLVKERWAENGHHCCLSKYICWDRKCLFFPKLGEAWKMYKAEHTSFGRGGQQSHGDMLFSGTVVMPGHPFFLPESRYVHLPDVQHQHPCLYL